jgi:hypothetical protein
LELVDRARDVPPVEWPGRDTPLREAAAVPPYLLELEGAFCMPGFLAFRASSALSSLRSFMVRVFSTGLC